MGSASAWPLVGRREELDFIEATACSPDARSLVVSGVAGVGKTRLVTESLERMRQRELTAAWAVATHSAASLPFGALAHLLPHPFPAAAGPANLLRALSESLIESHPSQRLVVAVDDAHLLDASSAALIHHLGATKLAFILVTVRTGEPMQDAVRALSKDLGERLDLQPLAREAVEAVVREALPGEVDPSALRDLWRMSSGNLLLLRELIAGGLEVGTLAQVHDIWRWRGHPGSVPGLVDLVEARLAGVSPGERSVLEVIAAGEPLGAGMLADLASVEMLAALERAGVVETRRAGRRISVSMSHPLYGEIVRSATSPLRARTIAATLARALERTGARRRGDVLRLGTWFLQAGIHDRPEILLAAADEAAVAFDFSLAEALIRAAGPAGGLPGRLRLAEALTAQGRGREADDVHASSAALATVDEQRVHLAIARSMNLFWGLGRGPAAYDVLAQAQGTVSDPVLRNELAATRAVFLLHAGETDEAVRESLAILRGSHMSEVAGTAAAVTAAWGLIVTGRFADSSAQLGRAESVPTHPDQPVVARWLRGRQWIKFFLQWIQFFSGDFAGAIASREADYQEAMEQGQEPMRSIFAWGLGVFFRAQGNVVKAATRLREASAIFREVDLYRQRSSCVSELAHAAALSGDHVAAEQALAEAQSVRVPSFRMDEYFFGVAQAWTAAARGDVTHAARLALETARTCADMGQWLFEALALHDAVRLGEARAASGRLAELADVVEGDLADTLAVHAGALSARDSEGLAQISERFEAMGAILYAAEAAAEAAHAAEVAGRRSTSLALALRARNLAMRCEGARTPALAELEHPLPLTRREREIAVLAAQGLSNQEIADRLMVSVRTVEGHLNRAFAKLGVSQRRELGPIIGTDPGQSP